MKKIVLFFIGFITLFYISNMHCIAPGNPFEDVNNVRMTVKVTEKNNGLPWCVGDEVIFKVKITLPQLVSKVVANYNDNSQNQEIIINTTSIEEENIIFRKKFNESGDKNVVFTAYSKDKTKTYDTTFTITIISIPKILNDGVIQVYGDIKIGNKVALFIEHEKCETPEYQWLKDGNLILNCDTAILHIPTLALSDEGNYKCIFRSPLGSDTSKIFNMNLSNIDSLPVIVVHPIDKQVTVGNSAQFIVVVEGYNLSYQWQKNEKDIEGANQIFYETEPVAIGDDAEYRCVVSNKSGVTRSDNAKLTVLEKSIHPKIIKQPIDVKVKIGEKAIFNIVAEGTNLNYQWQKDGKNVAGATSEILEIESVQLADNNKIFTCIISNNLGEVKSKEAKLNIYEDETKPVITKHPQNQEATEGSDVIFAVVASGGDLKYKWQRDTVDIPGAINSQYTHKNVKNEDNGMTIRCIVSNSQGSDTSDKAILTVVENIEPPKITKNPYDFTAKIGESATFSVEAKGTNLEYQWKKDSVDIPNATLYSLKIKSVKETDNNSEYYCVVSNSAGKMASEKAILFVHWPPKIPTVDKYKISIIEGDVIHIKAIKSNELGNPPVNYDDGIWFKGNSQIGTGLELLISKSKKSDSGKYYFGLKWPMASTPIKSNPINVVVKDKPNNKPFVKIQYLQPDVGVKGKKSGMYCKISDSDPNDKLTWTIYSDPKGYISGKSGQGIVDYIGFNCKKAGKIKVVLRVSDGKAKVTKKFAYTIIEKPNNKPTVEIDYLTPGEGVVGKQSEMSATFSDPDSTDKLTWTIYSEPKGYIEEISGTGIEDYFYFQCLKAGNINVVLEVSDGTAKVTDKLKYKIKNAQNNKPVVEIGYLTPGEGVVGKQSEMSATFSDPDSTDELSWAIYSEPKGYIEEISGTGIEDYFYFQCLKAGNINVVLEVSDGTAKVTDKLEYKIKNAQNNKPVVEIDYLTPGEGIVGKQSEMSAIFSDPDSTDELSWKIYSEPRGYIEEISDTGVEDYFYFQCLKAGNIKVVLEVSDGTAKVTDKYEYKIKNTQNNKPVVEIEGIRPGEGAVGEMFEMFATYSDPDTTDKLSWTIYSDPKGYIKGLSGKGIVDFFETECLKRGTIDVVLEVSDGKAKVTDNLEYTINPYVGIDGIRPGEGTVGENIEIYVTYNDPEPNEKLTWTIYGKPRGYIEEQSGEGVVDYFEIECLKAGQIDVIFKATYGNLTLTDSLAYKIN